MEATLGRRGSSISCNTLQSSDVESAAPRGPSASTLRRFLDCWWVRGVYFSTLLCLIFGTALVACHDFSGSLNTLLYNSPVLIMSCCALGLNICFTVSIYRHLRVRTLQGGVKHLNYGFLRLVFISNLLAAVGGILLPSALHVLGIDASYIALRALLGVIFGVFMTLPAVVFVLQKQERTYDGTVQPMFYLRCLCLPSWMLPIATTALPFLLLSCAQIAAARRLKIKANNKGCQPSSRVLTALMISAGLPAAYALGSILCIILLPPSRRWVSAAFVLFVISSAAGWAVGLSLQLPGVGGTCREIEERYFYGEQRLFGGLAVAVLLLSIVLKIELWFQRQGVSKDRGS